MTTGAASYMAPTGPDILPTWAIRCSGLPEVGDSIWLLNHGFADSRMKWNFGPLSYPAAGAAAGTSLPLASLA